MGKFYEFNHKCDAMPDNFKFFKFNNNSRHSQFEIIQYSPDSVAQSTTIYGFRFCPYCGTQPAKDES